MHMLQVFSLVALAVLAMASPTPYAQTLTANDIIKVAPDTASCAANNTECATAARAAPYIAVSFYNYQINSFGAQAAVLALMLFESGDFKYSKNHFPAPGKPGQGTRNMQSPEYNLKYAQWLVDHCSNCGITADQVKQAQAQGPDAVLALVNNDQFGFASASWFLATQCDASVYAGLANADEAGFNAYLGCIGTSVTDDRTAGWKKVVALGAW